MTTLKYLASIISFLLLPGLAFAWTAPTAGGDFELGDQYTRHGQIPISFPVNPSGSPNYREYGPVLCNEFQDDTAEYGNFQIEIGDEFPQDADMILEVDWMPWDGVVSENETVIFTFTYRCLLEGTTFNKADTTTTATHTGTSGDDAQYLSIHTPATLDYDHGTNPLTHEFHCYFKVERSADTFAGDVCVTGFELVYPADMIPEG